MIGKQVKGKSFRGVLKYLHSKKESRLIAGNMGGKTPRTLSAEFAVSRQLNPRLSKAVYHSSLSLPKTEHLNDDQWSAIAEEYLLGMEFTDSQYVVYRHSDKDHDHIHIVASRIRITDGTTVNDSWDYVRSEKLIRELEIKYQLTPTLSSNLKQQRGQTSGEMRLIERTGEESIRTKLQQTIDAETEKPITMPELVNRLKERGIDAKITITRTGKIKGISYQLDGVATSGTHLGKAYTFPGLQKHREISYDHHLHHQELIKASKREPVSQTIEQRESERNKQIELAQTQQRERSLIIAPILRDYINEVKRAEIETKDYRVFWKKEEQTLYLYLKSEAEPRLKIKYQNHSFEPIESASTQENKAVLTSADVSYWQQFAVRLHQIQSQKKKQIRVRGPSL
jgi:Relaxase/Mobilisation nuclease domain